MRQPHPTLHKNRIIPIFDAAVASDTTVKITIKDRNNPIFVSKSLSKDRNNYFCAVSDAAVASDTQNHCSCKQTFMKNFEIVGQKMLQLILPRL
jgi:hypothetical protein